tara:strand:- start:349 stop:3330 length:2982 start_codon:yes stop_codon:yes gene_type:complete
MGGYNPIDSVKDFAEDLVGGIGDVLEGIDDIFDDVGEILEDVGDEVISWLIDQPDVPDYSQQLAELEAQGIQVNKRTANASIPVIYGTRKVGGFVVFLESSGTDNEFLYMAFVLSEGEITSVEKIFINENEVTWSGALSDNTERTVNSGDANFFKADPADDTSVAESLITVKCHYGTDSQSADSILSSLSSWTSNHKLSGLAYIAFKFKWNRDAFSSIPKVHALVKGRKVYNPNLDGTKTGGSGSHREDTSSTWEYSDNPVYQLLDYLRNDRFGSGIENSYFDSNYADWQTAGDVLDANITPFSGASQIDLLDSHAVLDTSKKSIDLVKQLLGGARAFLNYTAGQYKILVETTGSASITLTEDNILGAISVNSTAKNSRYNRVIVNFINPDKNYQSDEAQFPPVDETGLASADQHATMKSADGGILLEKKMNFPTIANPYQAQEMAEVILKRSRSSLNVSLVADATATDLAIGDIVNITHATPAFSAKPFRVGGITLNANSTVSLQLTEHQDSYYTFGTQQEVATIPDTTLPNPFSVSPPASLSLDDEMIEYNDGGVLTRLSVTITASPDKFANEYQVESKQTLDASGNSVTDSFRIIGRGSSLTYQLLNVIDGATYQVRAKAINSLGVASTFTSATRKIVGQTAVPSDVTNFGINVIGDQAILGWTAIPDLDLDFYTLRFSTDLSTPSYNNSFDLVPRIGRPATSITVPLKTGSYLIKAVDKLGNQSANATIVSTNIATTNFVSQTTINEHTAFSGTKTNTSVISRDSVNHIAPTITGSLGDPSATVPASSTYDFNNTIDLGAKLKALFSATITQFIEDVSEFFDGGRPSASTLFDDGQPAPFDGTAEANASTILQVSTSDDNTTFSDFKSFVVGEHIGRYFKFRVLFVSANTKARALISNLSVTASLAKRRESENDVSSTTSTSGKAITYDHAFKLVPAIGISAQNMATGDFYTITNKTVSGFTIEFFNSSGSTIDRTFDYIAEGVGQVIP